MRKDYDFKSIFGHVFEISNSPKKKHEVISNHDF